MYLSNNLKETEKDAIIKARIGQSDIRNNLIYKECKCKICGIDNKRYLIASHIKPWRESNNLERIDINNVFLLFPNHDALLIKDILALMTMVK